MTDKAPWFTMSEFDFTLHADDGENSYTMKWEQNPINYLLVGSITIHTLTGEKYRPSVTWSLVDRPNRPEHSNLFVDLLEKNYPFVIETAPAPVLGITYRIDMDAQLILLNIENRPIRLLVCKDGTGDFVHEITSHLFKTRKNYYQVITPDVALSEEMLGILSTHLSLFDLTPEAHKYKCIKLIKEESSDAVLN